MAVNVTIKSNSILKKQFNIKDVLIPNMRYGIMDDAFRLEEGKVGEYTVLFLNNHICRGCEITLKKGEVDLRLPLPTSLQDIQFFYEYVRHLAEKMHVKSFIRDEETITFDQIPECIQLDANASTDALKDIEKNLDNGNYENMYIFGAMNPITLGKKELLKIEGNIENLGDLMHSLQSIDAYYAAPRVYQKPDESLFGMYVLTEQVRSIFPYQAKLFMADKDIKVDNWYITFVVDGERAGIVSYEDFTQSIKPEEEYDTEHFLITLEKEEIENLLEQYKVEL